MYDWVLWIIEFPATEATCPHIKQDGWTGGKALELYLRKDERKGILAIEK